MKCVVNGWVWLPKRELTSSQMAKIKTQLTVTPQKPTDFPGSKPPEPIRMYQDKNGMLGIPRGFFVSRSRRNPEQLIQVSDGSSMATFPSRLRMDGPYVEQGSALEAMLDFTRTREWGGFLLQASCGFGKTNVALEFAHRLQKSTLILVHKEFFLRQWRERIEEFFPGADVGVIQQDRCEYKGKDFVLAMMQSIARDNGGKYPEDIYDAFGLVISDECHRIGAATWAGVVPRFSARWRLGLTATPRRKDRAEAVFFHHLGEILYRAKTKGLVPQVRTLDSDLKLRSGNLAGRSVAADDLKHVQVLAQLAIDPARNRMIADDIAKSVSEGRKVMVVSERLKQLRDLHAMLTASFARQKSLASIGFYIGGKSESDLKEAERSNVVLATKQMVEEGLDIPAIDMLYLATPISDVEQTAGRVRRYCEAEETKCAHLCPWRAGQCKRKPDPIIVDVRDQNIVQARKKRARRVGFYREIGVKI